MAAQREQLGLGEVNTRLPDLLTPVLLLHGRQGCGTPMDSLGNALEYSGEPGVVFS